jgi:hypothetical protein
MISRDPENPSVLCCPNCGGRYLHQSNVMVHARDGEDQGGIFTEVRPAGGLSNQYVDAPKHTMVEMQRMDAIAPRGRRNQVTIFFVCEGCSEGEHVGALQVWQHKGQTHTAWTTMSGGHFADCDPSQDEV